ncbi:MAG: lysophospholipase [Pseudomonadales bacterium]|nr:lysophospholipase [Pseudomonadales bacterium]
MMRATKIFDLRPIHFISLLTLLIGGCAHTPVPPKQSVFIESANYVEETYYNRQGLKIFVRTWKPQAPVRGNVVLLHGISLHSGLYSHIAEPLQAAGYRVIAPDIQGWGRSEGNGARGYVEHFDDYARDLFTLTNKLAVAFPSTPTFILGESLGATIALYTILQRELKVDGVVLCALAYKANPSILGMRAPSLIARTNETLASWWGTAFPNWPMLDPDLGLRLVVDDSKVQEQLLNDPLVTHSFLPSAFVKSMIGAGQFINQHKDSIKLPIFLLHGRYDNLIPFSSSEEIYLNAHHPSKQFEIYQSAHSVLLEKSRFLAVNDIIYWLGGLD